MTLASVLHVAVLALSVVVTTGLAGYAWRHRREHGATAFLGLMAGFSVYSGTHLIGLLTVDQGWRLFWEYVQWTGTAVVPVFWLLFALAYTGYDEVVDRRTVAALSVVPAMTVALTWTNGWHGLMWAQNTLIVVDGLAIFEQTFGPWFWVYTVFMYGVVGAGGVLLLRLVWVSDHLYADQAILVVLGVAAPIVASGLSVLSVTPTGNPPLDMTPYSFLVTGTAFGYALFRHRLFDLVPATRQLGRNAVIQHLEDGVVIVDTERQVLYINLTAAELFDCTPAAVLGRPVRSLVDDSAIDFDTEDALAEVELDGGVYEVRTSPIQDRHGRLTGHTLVVHDITARTRRERRLERLDDLNTAVRGVHRALVGADGDDDVTRAVCDRLVDTGLYQAACAADLATWNGEADCWTVAGADGEEPTLPSDIPVQTDGGAAVAVADPDDQHGTWTVVPLVYGPTVYGALALQSSRDDGTITDREREVLSELGELIGYALDAAENRRLLSADSVVELTFHSEDTDGTLLAAAGGADCRLELDGLVPNVADGHLAYLRTDGDPEAVATELAALGATRVRTVHADDGLLELLLPEGTLVGALVDDGAHVLEVTVADGTTEAVVEVATDADVRGIVDRVTSAFTATRLDAKHRRDRPALRDDGLSSETTAALTDRQREALETAYRAGYFDWPRESTAEEVAATLEITAPTLHAHLRKAEGALFADLFDRDRDQNA
ncbi:histidine kinase N-terminal 7TM domain-containing protein [Halomicroarcula sp. GCM10025709]|uniref:histidine kinase N-terminal 7TM domain-containing protein n=1 Tax=Haloarcula TaxID=2237 RepID=UPI0024C33AAA|nr:histidine kinase N-terminal 7TM domain-containing protein [Halomicroarcula sp. YJ-61-S]